MKLWPHQERGLTEIEAIRGAATEGNPPAICFTSPTGGGKSKCMVEIIKRDVAAGKKVSLYTNRRLLLEQISGVLEKHSIPFGIRAAGHERDQDKAVQLSSLQTEVQRVYKSNKWTLHKADTVLVDEAHCCGGDTSVKIINDHQRWGGHVIGFTATPLDIGHIYRHLVVAGTNSELRACGAHVIAHTYCPDEPDTRYIKRQASGEYSEADVKKVIMTPVIFGRVLKWWKKLNPDARPAILFGPGVGESLWFAEQFINAGVPAAHIDGDKVWVNGESYSSNAKVREQVLDDFRKGRIRVLCNRFVLREGIDIPEIYHCIFATVFGGLQSYLQSGGRVLRSHKSLDHVCVARDTMILTDRGEVPVQDVLLTDKVWDGVEFVSHDGATCNGTSSVLDWDGLSATPEHKVLTNHGWKEIKVAKTFRQRIVKGGANGRPIRVHDNSNPYNKTGTSRQGYGRGGLQSLRQEVVRILPEDSKQDSTRMPCLPAEAWRSPSLDIQPVRWPATEMHKPKETFLPEVWWRWNRVQVFFDTRGCEVGNKEPWRAIKQKDAARQDQQPWPLRGWQSTLGHEQRERTEQICGQRCWLTPDCKDAGGISVLGAAHQESSEKRAFDRTDKAEVWDIKNCGPRNRYVANGSIVANCIQDHGGNWHRHGDLNEDRKWELVYTNRIATGLREQSIRENREPEPIICCRCYGYRLWGPECPYCGYKHTSRSRIVIQKDGRLNEMKGRIYRPRNIRVQSDTEKIWSQCVHRCRRSGMTFNQAEGLFFYENHYYPPRTLPGMPVESLDWFLPIKVVPRQRLLTKEQPAAPSIETPW